MISLKDYTDAQLRLEELLAFESVEDSKYASELIEISNLIEQYEEIHYPMIF